MKRFIEFLKYIFWIEGPAAMIPAGIDAAPMAPAPAKPKRKAKKPAKAAPKKRKRQK